MINNRKPSHTALTYWDRNMILQEGSWENDFKKYIPLYLEMCCGSAFDWAAVMSGCLTGVSTQLKELVPYAVTTHCWSHKLSLAVLSRDYVLRKPLKKKNYPFCAIFVYFFVLLKLHFSLILLIFLFI